MISDDLYIQSPFLYPYSMTIQQSQLARLPATPGSKTFSEQQLIWALQQKQKTAFEYLYNNYSGALYTIILNIIPDTFLCEDLLQEVFIKIWRKMYAYDASKGALFTWMLNIAKNHAIDTALSAGYRIKRKSVETSSAMFITEKGNFFDPENIGLRKMVNRLDKSFRDVIVFSYFQGCTDEQISRLLGTPIGTVKTWKRKALIQLRKLLQE